MPTYDFLCESCGYIEIHHSIHDEHPDACPRCEGEIKRCILTAPPVKYVGGRGDIDDWRPNVMRPQQPTSEEADVPYE
jgi:putative FmdB family regulatory protein